jgi:hypothetical protein
MFCFRREETTGEGRRCMSRRWKPWNVTRGVTMVPMMTKMLEAAIGKVLQRKSQGRDRTIRTKVHAKTWGKNIIMSAQTT